MKKKELQAIRKEMKYAMQDMADELQIAKSTYARYEDGSASVPDDISRKVVAARDRNKLLSAGMTQRIIDNLPGGMCQNALR
jgi:transcriptional regulator with XRE-family HTH domain